MIRPYDSAKISLAIDDPSRKFVMVRFITITVNPRKGDLIPRRRESGDSVAVARMAKKTSRNLKQMQKSNLPNPVDYADFKQLRLEQARKQAQETQSFDYDKYTEKKDIIKADNNERKDNAQNTDEKIIEKKHKTIQTKERNGYLTPVESDRRNTDSFHIKDFDRDGYIHTETIEDYSIYNSYHNYIV